MNPEGVPLLNHSRVLFDLDVIPKVAYFGYNGGL